MLMLQYIKYKNYITYKGYLSSDEFTMIGVFEV